MATSTGNRNRLILLLIAGIPLTMILAASWLWYFVMRGDLDLVAILGTANRGTLVQPPRQITDVRILERDGYEFQLTDLEPRWTFIVPHSGDSCGPDCEQTLYFTRQIHVAMGKDFPRIRRLYVGDQSPTATTLAVATLSDGEALPESFTDYLETEQRGLLPLQVGSQDFDALFPEYELDSRLWYLADPSGWIMMSYNPDVTYKDVISDLKFLLKNASD